MTRTPRKPLPRLNVETLESRETPTTFVAQNFDGTALGTLPTGWSQWSSSANAFGVSNVIANSGTQQFRSNAASNVTARAWPTIATSADSVVSANVYTDSLVPTEIFARGQNLSGAAPTFYAVSITRGINIQLLKSVGGTRTVLASLTSTPYVSYQWIKVSLQTTGTQIHALVQNVATGQYLNSSGQWQAQPTNALTVTDSAISTGGKVGVNRPPVYSGGVGLDDFNASGNLSTIPPTNPPTTTPVVNESFDTTAVGMLPTGWQSQVDSGGTVDVRSGLALSPTMALIASAPSAKTARAWMTSSFGSDVEVTSAIYLDSLNVGQVFVRGQSMRTTIPSFYAVNLTRGLNMQLTKTVNGVTTVLSSGVSSTYFSYQWVKATLRALGNKLRVTIQRTDNNKYLASNGTWTGQNTWFREVTDNSLANHGLVGLGRTGPYSGSVTFDDFSVSTIGTSNDSTAPTVAMTAPTNTNVSGTVTVTAQASDNVGVTRVEFWLDGQLQATDTQAPYSWSFVTTGVADGGHTLAIKAYDAAGNVGTANQSLNVQNGGGGPVSPPGGPSIARHYQHIRIAQLAYFGTPIGSFEQGLLQNSVDLVIPNTSFLSQINSIAPNTPQLIYGNFSNLYQDLLLDWLNYADQHSLSRETAFYHVAQATTFNGGSPSSQPVNWLWRVARNSTNLTGESRNGTVGDVALGTTPGDLVYFGYLEKFRELNFAITTPAGTGWSSVLEYPTAVDAAGAPTEWATLNQITNTTNGLRQTGKITFDPPTNWKKSLASGTIPLYFVRLRVVVGGTAPVAATVLGRDYVGANGTTSGTMPAFDTAVDGNSDGYLNDTEYAARAAGKNARFSYESRLFYPAYGQMRFATNPGPAVVRTWAGDMLQRTFAAQPLADGVFVDNSNGKSPAIGTTLVENSANYSTEYGQLLAVAGNAIAPRWILANTTGGGTYTDQVVNNTPGSLEEFALRPLDASWSRFLDVAGIVSSRLAAPNAPYLVLDSHPQGGSQTDSRTQLATLAYYYLLGDPVRTFLMFFGGVEPSTTWTRHWTPAAAYNIGQPSGNWTEFATGNDPANTALQYKVYRRNYTNAIVLYKPRSYKTAVGTGTTADSTATIHQLGGSYRPLRADGTLGSTVTSVTLRNGEGAILVPA